MTDFIRRKDVEMVKRTISRNISTLASASDSTLKTDVQSTQRTRRRRRDYRDYRKFHSAVQNAAETFLIDYTEFNDYGKSGVSPFSPRKKEKYDIRRSAMRFVALLIFGMFFVWGGVGNVVVHAEPFSSIELGEISWADDYEKAIQTAKDSSKNLLIYFVAETDSSKLLNETEEKFVPYGKSQIRQIAHVTPSMQRPLPIAEACRNFERQTRENAELVEKLADYVLLKLPLDAKTKAEDGKEMEILSLPEYAEMLNLPGFALLDFTHENEPYYGELVGILPFVRAKIPTVEQTSVFLSLPPGTLTQRTLIYAVRTHPERPLSAEGEGQAVLFKEARDHSAYQAKVRVLGHQNFGARTQRIASALNCIGASEVCAQSWSGEGLYEGAIGCVRSWRTSPAHWKGVKAPNRYYGYDMVRGTNGVWYATGLFVKQ